jgi:ribosome biogenesis protein NSA2
MPQHEHIERWTKKYGKRYNHDEVKRKREARAVHKASYQAQKLIGIRAKLLHKRRYSEKAAMKKQIKMHDEKTATKKDKQQVKSGAIPSFLLDREEVNRAKILSNTIKQKRKEKAGKYDVPIPKVKAIPEAEIFKVITTGKKRQSTWKRMITKATFVSAFTRKPAKFERIIRPKAMRFTKAHVTHPELKCTFYLDIVNVKKNPQGAFYTSLGVITKGTILEVNVSELGLVTQNGKVVWAKFAQVTNNPENDGVINAILLV